MTKIKYKYNKDYTFDIHYKPENIDEIHPILLKINEESNRNFKYGLFDPNKSLSELKIIYKKMLVCIMYKEARPIGFYYFYILSEMYNDAFVHLGLVVIHSNQSNIFTIAEAVGVKFLKNIYNSFTFTTITTIPKVLETLCLFFDDVFPNPKNKLLARPPKKYSNKIDLLCSEYVDLFFPNDLMHVDRKRFILILNKRENGFDDKFHQLPKANGLIYNLFCQSWLDYEAEEDMIVMGRAGAGTIVKINILLFIAKIRSGFHEVR